MCNGEGIIIVVGAEKEQKPHSLPLAFLSESSDRRRSDTTDLARRNFLPLPTPVAICHEKRALEEVSGSGSCVKRKERCSTEHAVLQMHKDS